MIHEVTTDKIKLAVNGVNLPVATTMRYNSADPLAVKFTFSVGGDEVEWIFSRDLLLVGMTKLVGEGDVKIWPCVNPESMWINLSSPEGEALFECDMNTIQNFLSFTFKMVRQGQENLNLDDMISRILEESL